MSENSPIKVFIFTALPCEAKPLVARFKLKKRTDIQPFAIYCNDEYCLTVTGVGKVAMSAGVSYTLAMFNAVKNPVMINIGVAGHKDKSIGSVYLAEKITDGDSGRHFYPPLIASIPCSTMAIYTSSTPQLGYVDSRLCEMEASAFYETATRFVTGELVQCIKVVSDNQETPADTLNAKRAELLIEQQLELSQQVITGLLQVAEALPVIETPQFAQLVHQYRFTASERKQLKDLLACWAVLYDEEIVLPDERSIMRGKDVLVWLKQQIESQRFIL